MSKPVCKRSFLRSCRTPSSQIEKVRTLHERGRCCTPGKETASSIAFGGNNQSNMVMNPQLGFETETVTNGRTVDALQREVRSCLHDCHMPEMDGMKRRQHSLVKRSSTPHPIVTMTASALPEDRARCITVGMTIICQNLEPMTFAHPNVGECRRGRIS